VHACNDVMGGGIGIRRHIVRKRRRGLKPEGSSIPYLIEKKATGPEARRVVDTLSIRKNTRLRRLKRYQSLTSEEAAGA
jgi:hypothetical protein